MIRSNCRLRSHLQMRAGFLATEYKQGLSNRRGGCRGETCSQFFGSDKIPLLDRQITKYKSRNVTKTVAKE